ncbi:MAG: 1-acyl-sn-glycerol-3-phosphate acyltransferase, partial [Candidatus Margulisbacteria bacterium]|nr:1-acyl-sn-glycerol-3-phosphate acyltransferase [Candidatus Margulisiibacteriota bacterium]
MIGYCRRALLWIAIIASMPLGILPLLFMAFFLPKRARLVAVCWGRFLLWISGFRVSVKGLENIPQKPLIIA